MTIETLRELLGWSAVINMGLLLFWAFWLMLAHDIVYKLHSRWVKISEPRFDELNYQGMMFYKLFIFGFNIVPYLAIRIIS